MMQQGNKNGKLISVIVPVYNVEKYLHRCIYSIINQKYSNLEIILVDDGSTDSSGKICEEFKDLDNRIKVIHKKNGGLSSARNYGLDIANGDYVAFVDSDDYIDERMLDILLEKIELYDADISMCGYIKWMESEDKFERTDLLLEEKKLKKEDAYELLFCDRMSIAMPVAWNKLYRRKLWNETRYPEGKYHEDEYIIHHLIAQCNYIVTVPEYLYIYSVRENSIMTTRNLKASRDWIEALVDRKELYEKLSDKRLLKKQQALCIRMILWECKKTKNMDSVNKEFVYSMSMQVKKLLKESKMNGFIGARAFSVAPVCYISISKLLKK